MIFPVFSKTKELKTLLPVPPTDYTRASMAVRAALTAIFLFVLALSSNFVPSACRIVKGKISCADCGDYFNLSGVKILLKCDGERKPGMTTTTVKDGGFQAELPGGEKPPMNCLAKILGGPEQLYAHRHDTVSQIVVSETEPNTFTTSNPLTVSLSCPKPAGEAAAWNSVGSSKTVDMPGTGGMGLPPANFYIPFLPIIGIP